MEKKCKNKKCQKILPEGYKHTYCENCRNEQANTAKYIGEGLLAVFTMIVGVIVCKGKSGGKS